MSTPDPLRSSATLSAVPTRPRSWRSQRSTYLTAALCLSSVVMVVSIEEVSSWVVWGIRLGALALITATIWSVRNDRLTHRRELLTQMVHRALAEERLRLARNLHDIISDALGTITVRATVAHRLTGREGSAQERLEQARVALEDVGEISRETVEQLRQMLDILRTPPSPHVLAESSSTVTPAPQNEAPPPSAPLASHVDADDAHPPPPPLSPTPVLCPDRDVASILTQARRSGLTLDIHDPVGYLACPSDSSSGENAASASPLILPPLLADALHCALHNAARHAGPTRVSLSIHEDSNELVLRVQDEGPVNGWVPFSGAGMALTTLAQALHAVGGRLETRRISTGGFLLTAIIPSPHGPSYEAGND